MRQILITLLFGQLILYACNKKHAQIDSSKVSETYESSLIEIVDSHSTPTVELVKYQLIVDSRKDRKPDAQQILKVKRKWPLAMQSKSSAEFDSILSKDFTFKGTDSFYNRNEYIKDRTRQDEWIITFVKYDNVTLQFIGETGILSYTNRVTNQSLKTGDIEYEHITWVDIYVLEEGRWKIASAHSIDYRLEIPLK